MERGFLTSGPPGSPWVSSVLTPAVALGRSGVAAMRVTGEAAVGARNSGHGGCGGAVTAVAAAEAVWVAVLSASRRRSRSSSPRSVCDRSCAVLGLAVRRPRPGALCCGACPGADVSLSNRIQRQDRELEITPGTHSQSELWTARCQKDQTPNGRF